MAVRNVIKIGDPLLREVSAPVTRFDDSLSRLIDDMFETMEYENGVGLAAVQVGVLRRLFVVCAEDKSFELVNPKITAKEGRQTFTEGCLSIPNKHGIVSRPKKITVEGFDRKGTPVKIEAEDFLAVVLSHELDHLDGIVFTDKADKITD